MCESQDEFSERQVKTRSGSGGWRPGMEARTNEPKGRQVKCLIASEGHQWMRGYFDKLPRLVRKRLRESPHNICSACLTEQAQEVAAARRLRAPTIAIYLATLTNIERALA